MATAAPITAPDASAMAAPPPGYIAPKEGGDNPNAQPDLGPNNEKLKTLHPRVVESLREMVLRFRTEGLVGRRHEIRRIKKNRLFYQGLQYASGWDADQQDWQMPQGAFQGLRQDTDEEAEQGGRYEFVTNLYQASCLSFMAVMTQDVPSVNWFPQKAQNDQDIATAKAASEVEKVVQQNNHVEKLLNEISFFLWTDGKLGAYVRWVADGSQFGFHDNPVIQPQEKVLGEDSFECPKCGNGGGLGQLYSGMICPQCGTGLSGDNIQPAPRAMVPVVTGYKKVPNGQEVISIVGGLELNTPVWAYEMHQMPYLQWQLEVHQAKLKASYPHVAKEIRAGNPNDADDVYARASRTAVEQGLPTTHPGDALFSLVTFTRNWIRPWSFFDIEDEQTRSMCLELFPSGCYVAFAGDTYCESRDENMDDHWRVLHALPGDGQNRPAVGDSLVSVQERYNIMSNLRAECVEFGYPAIYADPQVVDFDALEGRDAEPASHVPAKARAGQPLSNSFFQPNAASVPQDWVQYEEALFGPISQFLTGLFPAVFGGGMEDQKTASGYALARDQAMGRLGLVWRRLKVFWAEVMGLAVDCFRKNRTEDYQLPVLGEDGEFESKVISIADLRGNMQARAEADETFPRLKSQQRAILQQFMALAPNAPELAEIFTEPANLREIRNVSGLRDLVIPGEDSANKQLREIAQLLQGKPVIDEMPGQPGPDGTPGPAQKIALSTVPVNADLDRHSVEMKEIVRWANAPAGIKAKMTNPAGFANVQAHWNEHNRIVMSRQGGPQTKPVSEAANFKDLPASGKVQMAAQAGIQLSQDDIEAKEERDRQDKKDELHAKLAAKPAAKAA